MYSFGLCAATSRASHVCGAVGHGTALQSPSAHGPPLPVLHLTCANPRLAQVYLRDPSASVRHLRNTNYANLADVTTDNILSRII